MSLKSGPTRDVIATSTAGRRTTKVVVIGLGSVVLGALLGLIAGANIGGNWFASVSFGGQHGYGATGLLGAVVGGFAIGALGLWQALRRRRTS